VDGGSTLFNNNDDTSAASTSSDSAVINTDDLLGGAGNSTATATPDPAADSTRPTGQVGDPLASVSDESANATVGAVINEGSDDIVPNETITTNDWSRVGEVKQNEPEPPQTPALLEEPEEESAEIAPEIVPEPAPTSDPEVPPFASELKFKLPGVDDPEKIAFIKTYTEEFDEALKRATDAAQAILDAIDKAVHEHSPDITVPEAAEEFLAKKPASNKVEKFEDAREIVHEVLARAADAKAESAKAATEAARIYDEVQTFKKETKDKITELTAEQQ
jgi:hypothetical protein